VCTISCRNSIRLSFQHLFITRPSAHTCSHTLSIPHSILLFIWCFSKPLQALPPAVYPERNVKIAKSLSLLNDRDRQLIQAQQMYTRRQKEIREKERQLVHAQQTYTQREREGEGEWERDCLLDIDYYPLELRAIEKGNGRERDRQRESQREKENDRDIVNDRDELGVVIGVERDRDKERETERESMGADTSPTKKCK